MGEIELIQLAEALKELDNTDKEAYDSIINLIIEKKQQQK